MFRYSIIRLSVLLDGHDASIHVYLLGVNNQCPKNDCLQIHSLEFNSFIELK